MTDNPYGLQASRAQKADDDFEEATEKLKDQWEEQISDIVEEAESSLSDLATDPDPDADLLERLADEFVTYGESLKAIAKQMRDPTLYA